MAPQVIGPYRIIETLGSGGVGTVYRAVHRQSGESVALKLLSTGLALDPKAARRLAREFETLSELSHTNIVKVFDTGVFQGYPYLAMELVEGLTLRHYLDLDSVELSVSGLHAMIEQTRSAQKTVEPATFSQESATGLRPLPFGLSDFAEEIISEAVEYDTGPESVKALARAADEPDTDIPFSNQVLLPFDPTTTEAAPPEAPPPVDLSAINRASRIGRLKDAMLQISQALAYIHGHGLIHRDLKPTNIMVDEDRLVRLMDFGLAKFLADDSAVTANGRMVGTFRYMSPEQVLGEPVDARADLYSLGVILYEMLTGQPPFDARTPYELWQKILEADSSPIQTLNPRADDQLAKVAQRLIRKEPDDRYQTAEEVYEALSE